MTVIVNIFVIALQIATITDCKYVAEFPREIIEDILTVFFNGTAGLGGDCLEPNEEDDSSPPIQFQIFSRESPDNPAVLTEPDCDGTPWHFSPLIFIVHGWIAAPNSSYIVDIKDAYLERYNTNVVLVDWEAYAGQPYACAYQAVPLVAKKLAAFLQELKEVHEIPPSEIHLVGHSLGAHVSGISGDIFAGVTGVKLGRITGLDPAGPFYYGVEDADKLDAGDAEFVDVIHTAMGTAGFLGRMGDLDSYANCGYFQPGCLELSFSLGGVMEMPVDGIDCSHVRSCLYFAESINSDRFVAGQCEACGLPVCFFNFLSSERVVIGEDDRGPGNTPNYVFYTHSSPAFAEGRRTS